MPENAISQKLYATPFSPSYWKMAAGELKNVKVLAMAALFIAVRIVISAFFIPIGENLRIYFSFFVNALGSMICGPVIALISGFICDILGYIISPSGAFFFGYVLTSMMGSFVYALFLYRARISIVRVFLCKLSVNIFVNMGLNCLWSAILYGKGYYYYLAKSIVKNLTLLPLEVFLLIVFLQVMIPIMEKSKIIPQQPKKLIAII